MSVDTDHVLDIGKIREEFPILSRTVRGGKPLVYLDNAATTQKPRAVLETLDRFYRESNANVHRGVHDLSERATAIYEGARRTVAEFLNAGSEREVVFTRGTTESVNLVANTLGERRVGPGDEVLITHLEHHSNIVPWQMLCERKGARLVVAPIDDRGEVVMEELAKLLSDRTRIVAVSHASNALGTVVPVREIVRMAHERGVPVLVDGAQAVHHLPVDVAEIGCDFYAFSGHKCYGPTGIGVLWGRPELLDEMPPWQGGGDMILSVSFAGTVYNAVPAKFEAGTPDIAGAAGLAAALDWLSGLDLDAVRAHERDLLEYGTERLSAVPGLRMIGTASEKTSVLSFVVDGAHPHDLGTILDRYGVAIRAGHHCAQPVMDRFGIPATTRASIAVYNTRAEIDAFVAALREGVELLS